MAYIDPYEFLQLDIPGPEALDKAQLRRAKKRILAEFELSGEVVVRFGAHELDKSGALKVLAGLEDPREREFHWVIHDTLALKKLLETGYLPALRQVPQAAEMGGADFRKFLSRMIVPLFDEQLVRHIRNDAKPEATIMLRRLDLVDNWDWDTALKRSIRLINEDIQQILEVAKSGDAKRLADFTESRLWSPERINILNEFPVAYRHLRNRYGEALRDLAVLLDMDHSSADYVRKNKAWLDRMADRQKQPVGQTAETANTQLMDTLQNVMSETQASMDRVQAALNRGRSSGSDSIWGCVGWLALMVVCIFALVLIRGGSGGSSGYSGYKYKPITIPKIPKIDFEAQDRIQESLKALRRMNENDPVLDTLIRLHKSGWDDNGRRERPETGAQPYPSFLLGDDPIRLHDGLKIELVNRTSHDAVFLLQKTFAGGVETHFYVRSGETYRVREIPSGTYDVQVYAGQGWRSNVVTVEGMPVGAFRNAKELPDPRPKLERAKNNRHFAGTTGQMFIFRKDTAASELKRSYKVQYLKGGVRIDSKYD